MAVVRSHQHRALARWDPLRGDQVCNTRSRLSLPALQGHVGHFGWHRSSVRGWAHRAADLHQDQPLPRASSRVDALLDAPHAHHLNVEIKPPPCHYVSFLSASFPLRRIYLEAQFSTKLKSSSGEMSTPHETEKEKVPTEVLHGCYFSPCVMYAVELNFFPPWNKRASKGF